MLESLTWICPLSARPTSKKNRKLWRTLLLSRLINYSDSNNTVEKENLAPESCTPPNDAHTTKAIDTASDAAKGRTGMR
jgi:hypothetical protein